MEELTIHLINDFVIKNFDWWGFGSLNVTVRKEGVDSRMFNRHQVIGT